MVLDRATLYSAMAILNGNDKIMSQAI